MLEELPNCQNAYLADSKLYDYLLNLNHPEGKGKAQFYQHIGYTSGMGEQLRADLLRMACYGLVISVVHNRQGTKYIIRGSLTAPNNKTYDLLTVWVIEQPENKPRLITAYPND